jgi:hypothetical protein
MKKIYHSETKLISQCRKLKRVGVKHWYEASSFMLRCLSIAAQLTIVGVPTPKPQWKTCSTSDGRYKYNYTTRKTMEDHTHVHSSDV